MLEADLAAAQKERELERAAAESMIDELTGLYNRRGWNRFLAVEESRHRRYGHPASLVPIDMDGLKPINDLKGHHAGDIVLHKAAEAISSVIRKTDVAARLGGDEFAILCSWSAMSRTRKL